jgi:hypothetical protein
MFAAIWAAAGLWGLGAPIWMWVVPALISAVFVIWCFSAPPSFPIVAGVDASRIMRLVGVWSAVEGIAIGVAVNVLGYFHNSRLIGPVVGLIVGLHFLPLAYVMRLRTCVLTGLALITFSLLAMVLPDPWPLPVVGLSAAPILWVTGFIILRRVRAGRPFGVQRSKLNH